MLKLAPWGTCFLHVEVLIIGCLSMVKTRRKQETMEWCIMEWFIMDEGGTTIGAGNGEKYNV